MLGQTINNTTRYSVYCNEITIPYRITPIFVFNINEMGSQN